MPENPAGKRRTRGLRREELAARAGIGTTWLTWIEQGRPVRASAHALARLAAALQLTPAERAYLFTLGGRHDPADPFAQGAGDPPAAIVAVASALAWPAYGIDPAWTVCSANAAARAVFLGLFDTGATDRPNLLRYLFLHPDARRIMPDWPDRCQRAVAEFRRDHAHAARDPRVAGIVAWLNANSPEFGALWGHHAVLARDGGIRRIVHPQSGALAFRQHSLASDQRADFRLIVLEPVAG